MKTHQWLITKTGAEIFDMLHAYGLAILIANATNAAVEIYDSGISYKCRSSQITIRNVDDNLLVNTLAVPSSKSLVHEGNELLLRNFDGLLAALFTVRGVRILSMADAVQKEKHRSQTVLRSLEKVKSAITRWLRYVNRSSEGVSDWLSQLIEQYDEEKPIIPGLRHGRTGDVPAIMTLDPAFGLGTRRPLSDGLITNKASVAIDDANFATILAYIGAARFLRAQRVSGRLVNLYVPIVSKVSIEPTTSLPRLSYFGRGSEQALVLRWLKLWESGPLQWQALAYQTLLTHRTSQSISRCRGWLGYKWLNSIGSNSGSDLIQHWRSLLSLQAKDISFDLDYLVKSLLCPTGSTWYQHLRDVATYIGARPGEIRPFRLCEVREIFKNMDLKPSTKFYSILERNEGTLRFGHAFRQLREIKPTDFNDLAAELECVITRYQLLRILAHAVQEFTVAKSHSPYIIIPSDDDLRYLLLDVDQHGAKDIAGLLIILSTLRYPRGEEAPSDEGSLQTGKNVGGIT